MRKHLMLLMALAVAGCVQPPPVNTVSGNPNPPAPPVQSEVIPKPPVSEEPLIWQPGHWDWLGTGYSWRPGEWIKRAGHGTEWQDGYWTNESGRWEWRPAHWL